MRERIAVIGGGMAGLTAAHLLGRRHDVTLFERSHRVGGNAYTFRTSGGHDVDIAVAAFGRAGYRSFYRLLDDLGVPTRLPGGFFISTHDVDTGHGVCLTPRLAGLVAQRFALLGPSRLLALLRLGAGLARLRAELASGALAGVRMEEAIERIPSLRGDARVLLLCALCLLSSMYAAEVLAAPAAFFMRKLTVHRDMLSPRFLYSVRCATHGTKSYVDALERGLGRRPVLEARIAQVRRDRDRVTLLMADGATLPFDRVVLATNADQALALLEQPTEAEARLLSAWRYKEGRVVVHRDHSAFPPRPLIQAYTFLYSERGGVFHTSVTGATWCLPGVGPTCDVLSTQHPNFPIAARLVEHETVLRTPIFDERSVPTISELPALNGVQRTYYCGSHFGFGLHEDAVSSAVSVAAQLGCAPAWAQS